MNNSAPMVTNKRQKPYLLLVLAAVIFFPWLGGYLKWGGLPPGFEVLASSSMDPAGFDLTVFIVLGLTAILTWAFVFFPRLFGFKPAKEEPELAKSKTRSSMPIWFWLGGLVAAVCWIVMWGQFEWLGALRYYCFVPLWWGYIFFLDGIVYYRNDGVSFVSSQPKLLLICALLSIPGWYYFEYLNFFVLHNWYYPYLDLLPSPFTYVWSAITFSTIWPALFIWYQLLLTFKPFRLRYANGPKINWSRKTIVVVLIAGILMTVATSIWYQWLFWMIWLGPMLIVATALALLGVWTPFSTIRNGDWTAVMLVAVGTVFNSVTWEMWNYWSTPNNPNFWRYDLPYVHQWLIFEMPLLGFSGYLFFGPVCWVFWILCARLLGFSSELKLGKAQ